MKILLVDDDDTQLFALEMLLGGLGHEVVGCDSTASALRALESNPDIAVVVSDWAMPDGDGLELCRRMREFWGKRYRYFILLTATLPTSENQSVAFEAGVDDFLTKPANTDELRLRLHVAGRIMDYISRVSELESFIPICSYCKKVRDDAEYWQRIEDYIGARTGAMFSHCICPSCMEKIVQPQIQKFADEVRDNEKPKGEAGG